MTDEEFLVKYEELIKNGYCDDCNELNCLDSNASYRLLEIIKKHQKALDKACEELEKCEKDFDKIYCTSYAKIKNKKYWRKKVMEDVD